ncbi:hypothetical protein N665_0035s0007, partial [Sinapis alba]
VGIKPLSKKGLNNLILTILRDTRFKAFEDSLLSSVESSLLLQIKMHNYEIIEGSIPIGLIFRVHYKAMTNAFSSKVKFSSKKGETLSVQWKDVNLPHKWVFEGAVQPKLPAPQEFIEPNTRSKHIEQFRDGKVRLSFIRNNQDRIDEYLCVSQLGRDFAREEKIIKFCPRFSTWDIPNSVLRNSQLSKVEIEESSMPHNSDIPHTPTSKIQINTLANDSDISECSDQNFVPKINHLDWQNHQDRQLLSIPDDQIGNEDKTVAELLIAGFSGHLKGWWNNYLTNQQRTEILDSIKIDEDNVSILDNLGNPQQDDVATLVITITLHFIGDPSVLRDKNVELLSKLKCKALSDFQWYKNTVLTRVLLLGTQKTRVELGSFGKQFEIDPNHGSKSCVGNFTKNYYSKTKPRKHSKNYKSFENRHTSKFCRFNRKIQELNLGEEISGKLSDLLLNDYSSSYDPDSSMASESPSS